MPAQRWRPVCAYAALSAANQMLWLTFAPITTGSARHYGVSEGALGWLAELFPLLYVVLALPADRANGIAVSSAGIFAGMVLALATGAAFGAVHLPALLLLQAVLTVAATGWLVLELRRPVAEPDAARTTIRLGAVWADRQVRVLVGLVCVGVGAFVAVTTWLQTLLKPAGVGDTAAGVLLLVMGVAGVAASATVPPIVARRGAESHCLLLSVVVGALAFVLLASAPGVGTGLVAVVGLGVFLLADLPVILDLAERRAGDAGGTVSALIWLAGNAAGLVAALLVQVLDGHPAAAFLVLAALVASGVPLVRMLTPQRAPAELS